MQIVSEADKIYGVTHANRLSQIDVITKEDALAFLQSEEEAQQQQRQQEEEKEEQQQEDEQQQHEAGASKRSRRQ